MQEILKSEIINTEKSRYNLELIKAANGLFYVSIGQSIFVHQLDTIESNIRIRPSDLDEIIQILVSYQSEIRKNHPRKRVFTDFRKKELINKYLNKCLEIETLAVQFDCSVNEIKQIFFENNIAVTSNSIAKDKPVRRRFWRRKRSE
ncbi:hypothetical protein [Dyadobacter sp. CY356]|uniref:hypothetical protein n=1 Tax=Dyadobacter sp. CY356 TaxID=2906442 RepID=UPI001F386BFF|nr:hypothetical protein [Dyadobacter sp. CY356]MCF0059528.1 hypothetical protein [Dyadobacter sp. CY356]